MTSSHFINACLGRPTPRRPVWMMRQAGRYLPEYRAVRSKVDFLTLCKTPELASEVTLQPVDILGVDAAVIFSDILVLLEAMGLPLEFAPDHGPRILSPIRSVEDLSRLQTNHVTESLVYVYDSIRLTDQALRSRHIPVIGFAGAPFTLACYAVEGKTSRDFTTVRRFLSQDPVAFRQLLDRLAEGIVSHLTAQIQAGAAAVQLFDSWGGALGQSAYATHVLPSLQSIVSRLKPLGVPVILYVNGSSHLLQSMRKSGADVLSVDWRTPIDQVRAAVGDGPALQGNLDPTALYQSPERIREGVHQMLRSHPGSGYVANLGHGILPDIPVEHARAFVQAVKELAI